MYLRFRVEDVTSLSEFFNSPVAYILLSPSNRRGSQGTEGLSVLTQRLNNQPVARMCKNTSSDLRTPDSETCLSFPIPHCSKHFHGYVVLFLSVP